MHDKYMEQIKREAILNLMLPADRLRFLQEEQKANGKWAEEYRQKAAFEKEKAKMEARASTFSRKKAGS